MHSFFALGVKRFDKRPIKSYNFLVCYKYEKEATYEEDFGKQTTRKSTERRRC